MSNIEIIVDDFNEKQDNLNYIMAEFLEDDCIDDIDKYESYTLKQLTYICEYYGISKNIKRNTPRREITHTILYFENLPINYVIVNRRKQLWFYLSELKSDKY